MATIKKMFIKREIVKKIKTILEQLATDFPPINKSKLNVYYDEPKIDSTSFILLQDTKTTPSSSCIGLDIPNDFTTDFILSVNIISEINSIEYRDELEYLVYQYLYKNPDLDGLLYENLKIDECLYLNVGDTYEKARTTLMHISCSYRVDDDYFN